MDKQTEPPPEVTIFRNWKTDRWSYRDMGANPPNTGWRCDTDAQRVVSDLKTRANGRLRVKVDLS